MLTQAASVNLIQGEADKAVPRFTRAFLTTVSGLRAKVTDSMVAEDLGPGEPVETLSVLDGWRVTKAQTQEPVSLYADVMSGVAIGTAEAVEGWVTSDDFAALRVQSPFVHQAAEQLAARLVTNVTDETRKAIREIIRQAWMDGIPPAESAKLVRDTVGLTARQASQLSAFHRNVQGQDNARKLVSDLSKRLLNDRAVMIARTETIFAANRGQQLAWQEMRAQGVLPSGFRQVWITTPDDRLCETCAPMSGQTVQLNQQFVSSQRGVLPSERVAYLGGTVTSPPLHPQCRCALGAEF